MYLAVYAKDTLQTDKIITASTKKPLIRKGELTFGTFLGLCTGFLIKKVGKIFAMFVGTVFVFMQVIVFFLKKKKRRGTIASASLC